MGSRKEWLPITFVIEEGEEDPRRVTLREPVIKVGCLSSAHLQLDGKGVSRMHGYIQQHGDDFYLSDLGSAHGTFVNGQRVIELGDVQVTVELPEVKTEPRPHDEGRPKTLDDLKRKLGLKKDKRRREVKGDVTGLDFHQETAEKVWGRGPGVAAKTIAGMVRDTWRKRADDKEKPDKEKVYYCEKCLQIHGHIVEMLYVEAGDPDDDEAELEGYWCRRCQGGWRMNRGQARHYVSMQLQLYRALAKTLGILEIEEGTPPCPRCQYFSEVEGEGCDMLHAPHSNCPDFREKT